jgi:hypothetical protein
MKDWLASIFIIKPLHHKKTRLLTINFKTMEHEKKQIINLLKDFGKEIRKIEKMRREAKKQLDENYNNCELVAVNLCEKINKILGFYRSIDGTPDNFSELKNQIIKNYENKN